MDIFVLFVHWSAYVYVYLYVCIYIYIYLFMRMCEEIWNFPVSINPWNHKDKND